MANKAKASAASKVSGSKEPRSPRKKFGRRSASGKFVIAEQAVKSKRFSVAELRRAVRKVASERGSKKK
jgi:hypothetical protein